MHKPIMAEETRDLDDEVELAQDHDVQKVRTSSVGRARYLHRITNALCAR